MLRRSLNLLIALTVLASLHASGRSLHAQASSPDLDPRIEKLIGSVSEERLRALLEKLLSFGTRHTLSDQTSPTRGIGAARQWIHDELVRTSPRLQVSFDVHTLGPTRGA